MIKLNPDDFHDQAGMERAFQDYFRQVGEGSPDTFNAMLDLRLAACDFAAQTLTLRLDARPWMTNPGGILHGGITASVLDFTMGLLCRYVSGGGMTPTVSMEVNYLRAAPVTGTIYISAETVKRGRTFFHTVGSLYLPEQPQRLLATATGIYYVNCK